ncbi:MAG: hypothetical protein HOF58_01430 [Candidatus Marinimicrobia bacterium]|nr:hypothetical protein [Candidatus Neomarinimicrobiota bacterium]
MHRYIVLLLITGIVWAQTDYDKLVLKDGTTYLGEYIKIEGEIVFFKPLEGLYKKEAFEPVPVKLIKKLQLKDGQILFDGSNVKTFGSVYNEQKLSVKQAKMHWYQISPFEIFYVSILKRPARWTVNRGNGGLIGDEDFFLITESTQEQILLKNQLKLSRQQLFLSSISFLVGGWMALASQPGSVYGPLVVIISSGVLVDSKINYLYPVISFESAKIIAEQYNKNLLLKNNHQAPD